MHIQMHITSIFWQTSLLDLSLNALFPSKQFKLGDSMV